MLLQFGATGAITGALLAVIFAIIARRAGGKWFPKLAEVDPDDPATRRDQWLYYAANGVAVVVGTAGAALLYFGCAPVAAAMRFSPFDGFGRLLGPFFVVLGGGGMVLPMLARKMVRPGPLLHILHRANRRYGGADMTRALLVVSSLVLAAAILLHVGLRSMHTTIDEQGVRWRDWPWQSEQVREWSEVTDVRIVRTFEAMTGKVVERPHLVLTFEPGVEVVTGKRNTRPPEFWEAPANFASKHAGVAVRHVEK